MAGHNDSHYPSDHIINPARRVGIAVDSCALLTPGFIENNRVAVAPMRINIGTDSFSDNPRLDYNAFYGLLANEPNLTAWTAAPKPEVWLEAINEASGEVESVVCITVAAGVSASYDSARVAAKAAIESNPRLDVRVIDSGTISGALKLMAMDVTRAVDLGMDADEIEEVIREKRAGLRTVAAIHALDRIHLIARVPQIALVVAKSLNIKPVVTYTPDGFKLVATPVTAGSAQRKMLSTISDDVKDEPTKFIVLHSGAYDRAVEISMEIRNRFDCQFMNVSDFHPFVGFYSGKGAIGIAWEPD